MAVAQVVEADAGQARRLQVAVVLVGQQVRVQVAAGRGPQD